MTRVKLWAFGILLSLATGCATPALWDVTRHRSAYVPTLAHSTGSCDILVHYDEKVSHISHKDGTQWEPRAFLLVATNLAARRSDFVEITNSSEWIAIPLVKLDPQSGNLSNGLFSVKDARSEIRKRVTNQDRAWLERDPPTSNKANPRNNSPTSQHPDFIISGRNYFGQQLYVTNALPEKGYYWKLSASPRRYVSIDVIPPELGFYAASFGDQVTLWRDGREMGTFRLPDYNTYGRPTIWRVALTPFAVVADTVIASGFAIVVAPTAIYILIQMGATAATGNF